jgi:hypothetical protein
MSDRAEYFQIDATETVLAQMTWKLRWAHYYNHDPRLEQMWNIEHCRNGRVYKVTEEWRPIPVVAFDYLPPPSQVPGTPHEGSGADTK